MLSVKNLSVIVNNKKILNNFSLDINDGEIHVLMGQNGAGKSTVCQSIFNHYDYKNKTGEVLFNDVDITNFSPSDIAKSGIYIFNQSPISIEGVSNAEMLRIALEEKTGEKVNIFKFNKKLEQICEKLNISKEFIFRGINEGMSGGERKKNELLHMWVLEPSFIILDEVDSGLDVDALKTVAQSLKEYIELYNPSVLIVTHQQNLLDILKPDKVSIMKNGKIHQTGDYGLATKVFENGYQEVLNADSNGDKYE